MTTVCCLASAFGGFLSIRKKGFNSLSSFQLLVEETFNFWPLNLHFWLKDTLSGEWRTVAEQRHQNELAEFSHLCLRRLTGRAEQRGANGRKHKTVNYPLMCTYVPTRFALSRPDSSCVKCDGTADRVLGAFIVSCELGIAIPLFNYTENQRATRKKNRSEWAMNWIEVSIFCEWFFFVLAGVCAITNWWSFFINVMDNKGVSMSCSHGHWRS